MADTLKTFYSGTLGTSSTTLYSVPAVTKGIVKEILVCNKTASDATATITFDGINVIPGRTITAKDTLPIELHTVLEAGKIIAGLAGTGSAIDVIISGIEIA